MTTKKTTETVICQIFLPLRRDDGSETRSCRTCGQLEENHGGKEEGTENNKLFSIPSVSAKLKRLKKVLAV